MPGGVGGARSGILTAPIPIYYRRCMMKYIAGSLLALLAVSSTSVDAGGFYKQTFVQHAPPLRSLLT